MTAAVGSEGQAPAILVVDDDADIRQALSEILTDEGYVVATASNGAEALQFLKAWHPRLILLDLNMPVMSGAEFRLVQRLDPVLRRIPTVVLTAVDRMTDHVRDLGVELSLAKPLSLDEILAIVERYCGPAEVH